MSGERYLFNVPPEAQLEKRGVVRVIDPAEPGEVVLGVGE